MSSWSKWTPERIEEASRLWQIGMPGKTIALRMGVSWGAFSSITCNHRHMFPARMKAKFTLPSNLKEQPIPEAIKQFVPRRTYIAGKWVEHVKRRTANGDVVTLPRVSFIDGVREMAD